MDRLLTFFGVERERVAPIPEETWPLGVAPFIRLHEDGSGNKVIDDGLFGLLPHFAKELAYGRKTYNARSETVNKLPSFKESWAHGRRCIIPVEAVYEPNYETGEAVRWCIQQPGAVPMGIAGVYANWHNPDGRSVWSFAMITVNADGHPVYQRMHKPGEEKRMVTILDPADYDRWLQCTPAEAKSFFKQWQGPFDAFPAPLPSRARKPR
ncbi:MAG: SOS response-associated peptidase family protein [Betaproteobacteria bacterium]|nr:SOS response-associated peptidase family protein [Betaproteobacteria bacterium]